MFPSPKAENKEGCTRYFGWGSDPDGSAHCMGEEAALPDNQGGVSPQGPLNVTAGQLVTFAINWSDWHDGPFDWAIYIGTISGTISYPPYNVSYPRLVNTTLLASWTNEITFFGDPPTAAGPYLDNVSYVASGTLPDYNPKMLPNLDPAPFEATKAWVVVRNTVPITIPTSLVGTYTIRIITGHKGIVPPDPNDVRVLGNPFITLWGWSLQQDPNGYPWGEFVDITTVVRARPIYIRADGSVDPPTAPISSADNVTYAFTGNIHDSIEVERSDIIIDGKGYTVQGIAASQSIGISLRSVSNVTIKETNNKDFDYGIVLDSSSNNSISGNNITANVYGHGIVLYSSSNNSISENSITNNVNGIWINWSSNNTVARNNITNNNCGIYASGSSNNTLSRNSVTNNFGGIRLDYSSNNTLSENNVTANNWFGIDLSSSPNNILCRNKVTDNSWGIWLDSSSSNILSENNITNNNYGTVLHSSSNNSIYHNNYVDNTVPIYTSDSMNVWDDGYPSGGNYWSDYTGSDANGDGIGDVPYTIDANNVDRYPFMHQDGWRISPNIASGGGHAVLRK